MLSSQNWVGPSKWGRPCPLSFVGKVRKSQRRRLSEGKRANLSRRRRFNSSNAPLCQRTFCTPPATSLRNGAVAGLARSSSSSKAIRKEFAPRRSNDPELLLPFFLAASQQDCHHGQAAANFCIEVRLKTF